MDRIDGRKLKPEGRNVLRRRVSRLRQQFRMKAEELARVAGTHVSTIRDRLIGKYLTRWGFTPQRPIKRALEQRPEAVATWLQETYRALVTKARTEGAVIYFGDETAVKEDANWVRGCAPTGKPQC